MYYKKIIIINIVQNKNFMVYSSRLDRIFVHVLIFLLFR